MNSNSIEYIRQAITAEVVGKANPPSFELPVEVGSRGILLIGADNRISFTDAKIFNLLGVSADELLGRELDDVAKNLLSHRFKDQITFESHYDWLRDHPEDILEDVLEMVGPSHRVLHRYSAPLFDKDHNSLGRVEIYSDITKRRDLEAAVRDAYDELRATQDQLVQSEKLRAVGEIASGVAHDFNNTLGIILGNIQLLMRSVEDEAVLSKLKSAELAALDGVDTVRRIQEFTKTQQEEDFGPIDLSVLASEVVEMTKPAWLDAKQAQGQDIIVILDLTEDAIGQGNAPEIREVFTNILLNAIQAMPDGGTIEISTGKSKNSAWVKIIDSGIGMSEEVKKRIFDPFFTTRGVEGTGLGMSVAYGIVRRHNGTISVESEPGEGTEITITLRSMENAPKMVSEENKFDTESIEPANILVVDDEELFAEVFVEMLSECGHAVCVARSGAEAIEQFKDSRFDLVFTDLGMPEMSGWQVAKAVKDIEPETPVVLLTGWGASLDEDVIAESSVDMVLAKPIKFEKLSSVVRKALSARTEK